MSRFSNIAESEIINETNIGEKDLVSNWNHCLRFARKEYIILATDDDMLSLHSLKKTSTLIKKYPSIGIIRSGVKNEYDILLDYEFSLKEFMTGREFSLYYAKGGTISCVSNYIFNKDPQISNGGLYPFRELTIVISVYHALICPTIQICT